MLKLGMVVAVACMAAGWQAATRVFQIIDSLTEPVATALFKAMLSR